MLVRKPGVLLEMVTQVVHALTGARRQANERVTIHIADTQRFAGYVRFVAHYGDRQLSRQAGDKIWPDLSRVNGVGGESRPP